MSTASILETTPIIDVDAHTTEPPDLWTSRLPAKWTSMAPHVEAHPESGVPRWRVGDTWLTALTHFSHAGWKDYPPAIPPTLDEADPAVWQPLARLKKMDDYGIASQILYPNILGTDSTAFLIHPDQEFSLACVRAYNDFLVEEYYAASDRFIPIAVMPYWDLEASLSEMKRCADNHHRGILVANKYEQAGLPGFTDPHWHPLYAAAQEMELPVNFHIGFQGANPNKGLEATERLLVLETHRRLRENRSNREARATYVRQVMPTLMSNADTITTLLTSDICERFPRLNFISVESGFGYIPYLLEGLDWNWKTLGAHAVLSDRLLPSEYYLRQCYGTFWFEKNTLALLPQYPDNFMFATDFPHPTSLSPGPASPAELPLDHARHAFATLPDDVVRKAVHDNAARVYHLD